MLRKTIFAGRHDRGDGPLVETQHAFDHLFSAW